MQYPTVQAAHPPQQRRIHEATSRSSIHTHARLHTLHSSLPLAVTGGRNGYGAKLANIFSTKFVVETADSSRGLKYAQTFSSNMTVKSEPVITAYTGSDYTCITFFPDLPRFGMDGLDASTTALFCKRAIDMAGVLGKGVSVFLNGEKVPVASFADYVALYVTEEASAASALSASALALGAAPAAPRLWERISDRWEVCLTLSDGSFSQVSFVNAICTTKGGQHVTYVADQIANAVAEAANKKNKGSGVEVKPLHVRNYMHLFVNCLVENPAFDSQTKETLTTRPKDFGSTPELSEGFIKRVLGCGIVERVQSWAKYKATTELQRAAGGKKPARFVNIPKLDDANYAGHATKAADCTLILTEGDSAKTLAVAGMSVVGRDYFGVFPLKGKLLNVREASHKQIMGNAEIQSLVTIMGLQYGKVYESTKGLRYGHLMIMADQDHDGSHIKGLVLNFLHCFWPSLLALDGFLQQFITPIVKAVKGSNALSFFTLPQYTVWKQAQLAAAMTK
jgi:DNA topoisomerase-2